MKGKHKEDRSNQNTETRGFLRENPSNEKVKTMDASQVNFTICREYLNNVGIIQIQLIMCGGL
jgi:hypothetical protein